MKKLLFFIILAFSNLASKAQYTYPKQTVWIDNGSLCNSYVFLYATSGGYPCTEYYIDIRSLFSTSTPPGTIAPGSPLPPISNNTPIPGAIWYLGGTPIPAPPLSTYYFTGAELQFTSGCNAFSHWYCGIPCTGFPNPASVTTVPLCCGTAIEWSSAGPGTDATIILR